MTIKGVSQASMIKNYTPGAVAGSKDVNKSAGRDKLELSAGAEAYLDVIKKLAGRVEAEEPVRQERVQELSERIEAGDYFVDSGEIAHRLALGNV